MTRREAFEKKLAEAKQPPSSQNEHDHTQCGFPEFPKPPYKVRGIPSDARNYKLHIRIDSILMISIMQANGTAYNCHAQLNKEGEFYPTERAVSGNG